MAQLGDETVAVALRAASLLIYALGAAYAAERGILIADTKFEFGVDEQDGEIMLIDECLTPDSSRFWPASEYRPGISPPSFDKQFVRDYLDNPGLEQDPARAGVARGSYFPHQREVFTGVGCHHRRVRNSDGTPSSCPAAIPGTIAFQRGT